MWENEVFFLAINFKLSLWERHSISVKMKSDNLMIIVTVQFRLILILCCGYSKESQKNHLTEMILLSTYNIRFEGHIRILGCEIVFLSKGLWRICLLHKDRLTSLIGHLMWVGLYWLQLLQSYSFPNTTNLQQTTLKTS